MARFLPNPPPPPPEPEIKSILVISMGDPINGSVLSGPSSVRVQVAGTCKMVDYVNGKRVGGDTPVVKQVGLTLSVRENGQLKDLQSKTVRSDAAVWWQLDIDKSGEYWLDAQVPPGK